MNDQTTNKKVISLSTQILIGLALGVFVGLFFGDKASVLAIVGKAYIGLIQMSILPYMVVSLMLGIGSLTYEKAGNLAITGHRSDRVLVTGFCYCFFNAVRLSCHQGRLFFQYHPG